jgi:group I intron endonuclease
VTAGIYEIVNSANGKRYIGSAVSLVQRIGEHRSRLRGKNHRNPHLQNAWNMYGEAAFSFRTILVCRDVNLLFFEQRAIDCYRPEYNISPTAGNSLGVKLSPETKAKIAAKAIGRKWTAERVALVSAAMTGGKLPESARQKLIGNKRAAGTRHTDEWKAENSLRHLGVKRPKSPEYRAKIAASLRGRTASPEHRANQAAAQRGVKRGAYKPWSQETRQKVAALRAARSVKTLSP